MPLKNIHPGRILRDLIEDSNLSQTKFANHIGVAPGYISDICRAKRNISPAMAIKIAAALGGNAEHWLRMQSRYDLFEARETLKAERAKKIKPIEIKEAA